MRMTGPTRRLAVVCVNGGQANEVAGTWSASLEWLVHRLAPRFPQIGFAEVRYRVKSWKRLEWCIEDAVAAVTELGSPKVLLCGFSMGGAVAIAGAGESRVERVLGLAPWIPDRLDLSPVAGKRVDILHGSLDRWLPGVPGVSPDSSRRAFERLRRIGAAGTYTLIRGGLHGLAVRGRSGRPIPLPRAARWATLVAAEVHSFAGHGEAPTD